MHKIFFKTVPGIRRSSKVCSIPNFSCLINLWDFKGSLFFSLLTNPAILNFSLLSFQVPLPNSELYDTWDLYGSSEIKSSFPQQLGRLAWLCFTHTHRCTWDAVELISSWALSVNVVVVVVAAQSTVNIVVHATTWRRYTLLPAYDASAVMQVISEPS